MTPECVREDAQKFPPGCGACHGVGRGCRSYGRGSFPFEVWLGLADTVL